MAKDEPKALARRGEGWNGDDHQLAVESAKEAGLREGEAALDSFTAGFSEAIVVDDPSDHAIVARGRTVLRQKQLEKVLLPALKFLGIARDAYRVRLHDGEFELRLDKIAVDRAASTEGAPIDALKTFAGFGLLGFAVYQLIVPWGAGIVWGVGLLLGAWQLRRGLTSGRAMLAGKLAIALGMIAQEEGLVLPPAPDRPAPLPEADGSDGSDESNEAGASD